MANLPVESISVMRGWRTSAARPSRFWRAALRLAAAAAICAAAPAARANGPGLVERFAAEISGQVASADAASDALVDLAAYERARALYLLIEEFARMNSGETAAREELERLSGSGIDRDVLTLGQLDAMLRVLAADDLSGPERLNLTAMLHSLAESLSRPQYRVSALVDIALTHAERNDTEAATRYALRAFDAAAEMSDASEAAGAYNAIAQAAVTFGPAGDEIAQNAIAAIPDVRTRGHALHAIARGKLAATPLGEADSDELAESARDKLASGDLGGALLACLSIDPEDGDDRVELLNALLDAATKRNDHAALRTISLAFTDRSDQEDALLRVVREYIEDGRLLNASEFVGLMPSGTMKAEAEFLLGKELYEEGYETMAAAAVERGLSIAASLSGATRDVAYSAAIEALAEGDRLDEAIPLVANITDRDVGSDAIGSLAKRLADESRIADAEALLPLIVDPEDRRHALSGIAREQARTGNVEAARAALPELGDGKHRNRVMSQIAAELARRGLYDDAFATASGIGEDEYLVEAYLKIATAGDAAGTEEVEERAFNRAIEAAEALEGKERDRQLVRIVESLVKAGEVGRGRELVERIERGEYRSQAMSILAQRAALDGDAEAAFAMLDGLAAWPQADAAVAAVAIAAASQPAQLATAVRRVRGLADDRLRVRSFRAIAERQLHGLDARGVPRRSPVPLAQETRESVAVNASAAQAPIIFSGKAFDLRAVSPGPEGREALALALPDLTVGVAELRGMLPAPAPGNASVTLAHLGPYNTKFLEDLPDGLTGLSTASRYQRSVRPRIVVVESGVHTLGSLARSLRGQGRSDLVERQGDIVTLRAPVVVGRGATLILSGEEAAVYRLSATAGAYIVAAGDLYILDTTVVGYDEQTGGVRLSNQGTRSVFRPYLLGWSDSRLFIGGSTLRGLGYAAPKSFGVSLSAGPSNDGHEADGDAAPSGIIVDNSFQNLEYGFYSYEAENVILLGNEYRDSVLYAIDPHDRSRNLLIGLNTAYATLAKHGIIISREVDHSWIAGNVVFDNKGSGLMIDRDSVDTLIYANVAFDNGQDGLTIFESPCNIAVANRFFDNGRAGIKIRNSWNVGISGNTLEGNREAAIEAYIANLSRLAGHAARDLELDPYYPVTTFSAAGNLISRNGSGISVSGASGISLFANQFLHQGHNLFSGDARGLEGHSLRPRPAGGIVLTPSRCRPARPAVSCPPRARAALAGDGQKFAFDSEAIGNCTTVEGTVQRTAFGPGSLGM
jgi:poly(beta-D-mannuronate) C5 epimerase